MLMITPQGIAYVHMWNVLLRMSSQEIASWVEALGTVLAVCAAIWISSAESRRALKQERTSRKPKLQMALIAATDWKKQTLSFVNKGLGPAEIRSVHIFVEGNYVRRPVDPYAMKDAVNLAIEVAVAARGLDRFETPLGFGFQWGTPAFAQWVSPGEEFCIAGFHADPASVFSDEEYRKIDVRLRMIGIWVSYASVDGDIFVAKTGSVPLEEPSWHENVALET